ncbi:MAG: hypothetical protein PUB18_00190 [bacterium]|nr:hypothetical protein [bacterium]
MTIIKEFGLKNMELLDTINLINDKISEKKIGVDMMRSKITL